jgi:ubiquinone/menaquinone biosynthesis C-methylase UbiE
LNLKSRDHQITKLKNSAPLRAEGWRGWDEYAPFYDWENARTLGRRDVPFWQRIAGGVRGRVLELGCGTGRISIPLAMSGVSLVGIDRSEAMLARAARRVERRRVLPRRASRPVFVRGDIRALPFPDERFALVVAAYGILQSLVRPRDLTATLAAVARVLEPGGLFGIDLVPDVPNWREYRNRVQMRGKIRGRRITLIESVRQDRRRRLTVFEQRYVERIHGRSVEHRFDLTFRTLPMPLMKRQLERAGFTVEAVLGDYRGRPWHEESDAWLILARRAG